MSHWEQWKQAVNVSKGSSLDMMDEDITDSWSELTSGRAKRKGPGSDSATDVETESNPSASDPTRIRSAKRRKWISASSNPKDIMPKYRDHKAFNPPALVQRKRKITDEDESTQDSSHIYKLRRMNNFGSPDPNHKLEEDIHKEHSPKQVSQQAEKLPQASKPEGKGGDHADLIHMDNGRVNTTFDTIREDLLEREMHFAIMRKFEARWPEMARQKQLILDSVIFNLPRNRASEVYGGVDCEMWVQAQYNIMAKKYSLQPEPILYEETLHSYRFISFPPRTAGDLSKLANWKSLCGWDIYDGAIMK